jgi:hypothetical protein
MEAFIDTVERLPCSLDERNDALASALEGKGEVKSSGTGRAWARSSGEVTHIRSRSRQRLKVRVHGLIDRYKTA